MYLEERVEQLENASVDQGKQIELVAGGLATLTIEVRGIRQDMTDGFAQVRQEFTGEFAKVRQESAEEFAKVRQEMAGEFAKVRQEIAGEFTKVNQHLDEMSTTQELILTLLREKLK